MFYTIVYLRADDNTLRKSDLIIFSYDRPLQLYALLESLEKYVANINSTTVVYRTSNERYSNAFNVVAEQFKWAVFLKQRNIEDFKPLTLQALNSTSSDYVVFAVDDNIVKDFVDFNECINWLEYTNAYGFYLKLGSHLNYCYTENASQSLPPMKQIYKNIFSWEFDSGEKDWCYPNTVDMTLYRKKDLFFLFESLEYTNPNLLEGKWAAWWVLHKVPSSTGLFYESSKILNIPLNKVQTIDPLNRDMNLYTPQELLEKFESGLKMDITPLYCMQNKAVHTEYEPEFVVRNKGNEYETV